MAKTYLADMNRNETMKKVAIVDYGMCNLFSVNHACLSVGLDPVITSDRELLLGADAMIVPGVGAFGEAMENMRRLDLIGPIRDFIAAGKPFMGICLGMQLLFTESEEFGRHAGLDIIAGNVRRFKESRVDHIKVPQIGWNQIFPRENGLWDLSPLKDLTSGSYMYFVHSYYVAPSQEDEILSYTCYHETEYASSIIRDNVLAVQFHPEKSGRKGMSIYRNWASSIEKCERKD